VDAWAASAALLELVAAFGERMPRTDALPWLDAFSAKHWDFRRGRERNLSDPAHLSPTQQELVLACAPELGLSGRELPSAAEYDTVLMTGGMVRAGMVKPRHVAALMDNGLKAREVVFLGGVRQFAGDEASLAEALGVTGDTELDAMVAGMELAFGPLGEPAVEESDVLRRYSWGSLSVVVATSTEGGRRANSADTFRCWAEGRHPERVLVVTTPIYVPYQGAVATEILGLEYNHSVETVGTSESANDLGRFTQQFLPAHHLQELRSAIRAMFSLRAAAVSSTTGAARE
jgi:hypothetical protein